MSVIRIFLRRTITRVMSLNEYVRSRTRSISPRKLFWVRSVGSFRARQTNRFFAWKTQTAVRRSSVARFERSSGLAKCFIITSTKRNRRDVRRCASLLFRPVHTVGRGNRRPNTHKPDDNSLTCPLFRATRVVGERNARNYLRWESARARISILENASATAIFSHVRISDIW